MLPVTDRCAFFKGWLPSFIDVNKISRDWQYDLIQTKRRGGGSRGGVKRYTRRRHIKSSIMISSL